MARLTWTFVTPTLLAAYEALVCAPCGGTSETAALEGTAMRASTVTRITPISVPIDSRCIAPPSRSAARSDGHGQPLFQTLLAPATRSLAEMNTVDSYRAGRRGT